MSTSRGSPVPAGLVPRRTRRGIAIVELTGLAGIGKSHLRASLKKALGPRLIVVEQVRISHRDLILLPAAALRFSPLFWFLIRHSRRGIPSTLRFARQMLHHAWREDAASSHRGSDEVKIALAEEGWFHKLRTIRRFIGREISFHGLPPSARRRLLNPRVVLLLTSDPFVVCARRLLRRGIPVTAESLAVEHASIHSRGAWQEEERTRRDLAQAADTQGLTFIEVEYSDDYDVRDELLPRILAMADAGPRT